MIKKTLLTISFCTMQYINADQADEAWQKYNHKHQEAKEAFCKEERQRKLRQAAQDVCLEDHMKSLQDRCLKGNCTACEELKTHMLLLLEKRKKQDEAAFQEINENTEKINIILKDPLLSDAEKKELVRPLQERVIKFEKKLDEMGQWNFLINDIRPKNYYQTLIEINPDANKKLRSDLTWELRGNNNFDAKEFWCGKLENIDLIDVSRSENVKLVCLRVPAPTLHKFVTELFQIRIIKYLNALEEIIKCDCKE